MFLGFLYLPCYVVAEYPKEEGWAHTCVSRGMERDVFGFFVPAMLCRSRVPQGGGLGPRLCQQRDGEGCFLSFCTCHVMS